jgi:hypothetical protein
LSPRRKRGEAAKRKGADRAIFFFLFYVKSDSENTLHALLGVKYFQPFFIENGLTENIILLT